MNLIIILVLSYSCKKGEYISGSQGGLLGDCEVEDVLD
jgi:hypothetical protein